MSQPAPRRLKTRPGQPNSAKNRSKNQTQRLVTIIYLSILLPISIAIILFSSGILTIGGIPASIAIEVWQDKTARSAYLEGNGKKLHNRLNEMGIEERIKAFYRPRIPDETQLDQHIHQILYDRVGYVGDAYRVNSEGVLVLKESQTSDE
ncbi:MAG: hypothetical protein F6K47_30860 [Symploca sp. SIO2E6]|nr:hypothetical protein [Symploca sp. SIO2E6]